MNKRAGESSTVVRARVVKARAKQTERLKNTSKGTGAHAINCNARMRTQELREFCEMDAATKDLLKAAIDQFNLSGRGYDRILRVSRTIADLEDAEQVEMHHVAEAINYRAFDRKLFG